MSTQMIQWPWIILPTPWPGPLTALCRFPLEQLSCNLELLRYAVPIKLWSFLHPKHHHRRKWVRFYFSRPGKHGVFTRKVARNDFTHRRFYTRVLHARLAEQVTLQFRFSQALTLYLLVLGLTWKWNRNSCWALGSFRINIYFYNIKFWDFIPI